MQVRSACLLRTDKYFVTTHTNFLILLYEHYSGAHISLFDENDENLKHHDIQPMLLQKHNHSKYTYAI